MDQLIQKCDDMAIMTANTVKLCSKDKYIYAKNKIITNEQSRKISHLLRYKNQGILTSYKTINTDNPKLNCRIKGLEKLKEAEALTGNDSDSFVNSLPYEQKDMLSDLRETLQSCKT